jgi:hypothetical protein
MPAEGAQALDYEESTAPRWTNDAFEMLQKGELLGEVISSDGVIRSRVWGSCPRCKHFLDDRQTHTAVTNVFGGALRGADTGVPDTRVPDTGVPDAGTEDDEFSYYQVDVSCGCQDVHAGGPGDRTGCGASFRVELEIQAGRNNTRP